MRRIRIAQRETIHFHDMEAIRSIAASCLRFAPKHIPTNCFPDLFRVLIHPAGENLVLLHQTQTTKMKSKSSKKTSKVPEEAKKFLEYKKSKPFQLSLFDLFENEKDFSHTIELYEFMPKFVWGKVERVAGVFLHSYRT
jgi:hypothetical protein